MPWHRLHMGVACSFSSAAAKTKSNHFVDLRTFAPIATAHFFAHVTHTSCIADDEGKHDEWRKHFSQEWNVKACGIMGWLWTQVFSEMSRNDVTVRIDNRFENFAVILLAWMLGDPYFSFRRSLPFMILSILTKKKSVREKLQIFRLLCCRATEVFFLRLICIVFQGLFHLRKRHQLQKFI